MLPFKLMEYFYTKEFSAPICLKDKKVKNVNSPSAKPVTSFPSRRDTAIIRTHHVASIATPIVGFQGAAREALRSAGIVVSSTVAIPVTCQDLCPVVSVRRGVRSTILGVLAALALVPLFKIQMLACTTHPVS